jgi:hypothetical protein
MTHFYDKVNVENFKCLPPSHILSKSGRVIISKQTKGNAKEWTQLKLAHSFMCEQACPSHHTSLSSKDVVNPARHQKEKWKHQSALWVMESLYTENPPARLPNTHRGLLNPYISTCNALPDTLRRRQPELSYLETTSITQHLGKGQ